MPYIDNVDSFKKYLKSTTNKLKDELETQYSLISSVPKVYEY